MKNVLVPFRYFFFVAFIVSNAITCSTAIWNLSISQVVGRALSVDGYVAFVGAAALAFVFPIILIELARGDPVSARVWFECAWVAVFAVLEFCAAVALSAMGPGVMCNAGVMKVVRDSCTSTRVVLAFSWICTILLFGYLLALTLSAYMHKNENPEIWSCNVRRFDWGGSRTYMSSEAPKALSLPRFVEKTRPGSLIVPKPRIVIPNAVYTGEQHFQSQPSVTRPAAPTPSAAAPAQTQTASSFYPRHMQSVVATQPAFVSKPMKELPRSESPPPLGDWPRPSIISKPRSKRPEPSRGYTHPVPNLPSNAPSASRSVRPSQSHRNARSASSSAEWRKIPPPLDLSKISSHARLNRS